MPKFLDIIERRRSVYGIDALSALGEGEIEEIVQRAARHTPSAFNSQSARLALLFGESHAKFWGVVLETLRARVKPEKFSATQKKIGGFAAGFGTVLYFDETQTTDSLAERFPSYADKFTQWADHANGMLQFAIWNAFCEAGLAASLQHYNPIIDDETKSSFGLPASWRLIAQMPFGRKTAEPDEKEFMAIDERVKVFR